MKIILIGSSHGVGLTFYFTRLAIQLKRLRNDIVVISDTKAQYPELPNELRNESILHYQSATIDCPDLRSIIKGSQDLRRIINRERNAQIIHAGGVKHGIKVFLALRGVRKKPKTFATVGSLRRPRFSSLAITTFNFYDKAIALSNYTRDQLEQLHVKPEKIKVIPLFTPDLEWFDKMKRRNIDLPSYNLTDLKKPVVLYAARHLPFKGFKYYLLAALQVLKQQDVTFVIGGSGPLTKQLQNFANRLGIAKNVIFTGWISNYDLPAIMHRIPDICVSTSFKEQLPSYVMECMAAGKPVIASSVAGVPEIVINDKNGYIVPPHDFEQTASRIIELVRNKEKAKIMGNFGRKMVEEQLNMRNSIEKVVELYKEILGLPNA